jgi:hypothetical protein
MYSHFRAQMWLPTVLLLATLGVTSSLNSDNDDSSEACTKEAWAAYKKKNYAGAAEKAQGCIYFFQGKANAEEKLLEESKQTPPPTGEVVDPNVKQTIFKRGQLNDVATCYVIKGRSYEHIFLSSKESKAKDDAIAAYRAGCKYKFARAFDPDKQSFWSPAEESLYGLERLGSQCP